MPKPMAENSELNKEASKATEIALDDKDKFIINALNIHGSFFHKKCIEVIANQPSLEVIEKEFPIELYDSHTKIDIVAQKNANPHNFFIFECKKIDNEFKTWVFFPDIKHGKNDKSVYGRSNFKQPLILDTLMNVNWSKGGQPKIELIKYFVTPRDSTHSEIGGDICCDAYQIKMDYEKDGKISIDKIHKSTKREDIEKACNQVLLGSRGYAIHKFNRFIRNDIMRGGMFVPIVVTTASLMVCDVSSHDIDLGEGIVKDPTKIKLRKADWVVYNYKPSFMLNADNQIPFFNEPSYSSWHEPPNKNYSLDYTMSTYIVNANSLKDFLEKIQWIGSD